MSPSALAVFILITSSNLVGCSTGRSEGLAPLRSYRRSRLHEDTNRLYCGREQSTATGDALSVEIARGRVMFRHQRGDSGGVVIG